MCLRVKRAGPVKIASRNITVSKYLYYRDKKSATSPYRYFLYILGEEYRVGNSLRKKSYKTGERIDNGLHSCVKNKRKTRIKGSEYKAIIPKGARYMIGDDNDIVSSRLIVKERWKNTKK